MIQNHPSEVQVAILWSSLATMASAYVPKNINDIMVIRKVTENITTCSAPFARFGRMKIGGRGTMGMFIRSLALTRTLLDLKQE